MADVVTRVALQRALDACGNVEWVECGCVGAALQQCRDAGARGLQWRYPGVQRSLFVVVTGLQERIGQHLPCRTLAHSRMRHPCTPGCLASSR